MIPCATRSRQPTCDAWTLERLQYERSLALRFAIESTTASAYDSHLNSYLNFCRLHNHPVEPTEDTLSFSSSGYHTISNPVLSTPTFLVLLIVSTLTSCMPSLLVDLY